MASNGKSGEDWREWDWERRTLMLQVHPELHITVATCGDVEISLHFVALDAPVYPTRIRLSPPQLGRLGELPLATLGHSQVIVHILFISQAVAIPKAVLQLMVLVAPPQLPSSLVLGQHFSSQDAITRGILHVHVYVVAAHGHDDIEIYLELMRY